MQLRKGKTKIILESSIECALLAVEIYNKPRIAFRVEGFITNMIMAWTKLFHAHFHHSIGDKFYYKEKNGRYKLIDGEKKAWELKTCISKCSQITESQKANIEFFIKLRNKIEHRHIEKEEIGVMIFGECQSLLYNYENKLIDFFGEDYALNESLAFALQFSRLRTNRQNRSSKKLLSKEVLELKDFIDRYRTNLKEETYNCHYDEVHGDYVFQDKWVHFLCHIISNNLITKKKWKSYFDNSHKLNITDYEPK